MGRPKSKDPKARHIMVRFNDQDYAAVRSAAHSECLTMSKWARQILVKAASQKPIESDNDLKGIVQEAPAEKPKTPKKEQAAPKEREPLNWTLNDEAKSILSKLEAARAKHRWLCSCNQMNIGTSKCARCGAEK